MCCFSEPYYVRKYRRMVVGSQGMEAWKILSFMGWSEFTYYRYRPGEHRMISPVKRYNPRNPQGFHVYWSLPEKTIEVMREIGFRRAVRVWVQPRDLITAGRSEGVYQALRITPEDWKKAGLPKWWDYPLDKRRKGVTHE